MTSSFLDTLRALDAKATPGPWECGGRVYNMSDTYCAFLKTASGSLVANLSLDEDHDRSLAVASLIVALRNAAPRLAAVIEASAAMMRAYDRYVGTGEFVGGLYPEAGDLATAIAALEAP